MVMVVVAAAIVAVSTYTVAPPPLIRPPYFPRNCGHIRKVAFGERESTKIYGLIRELPVGAVGIFYGVPVYIHIYFFLSSPFSVLSMIHS